MIRFLQYVFIGTVVSLYYFSFGFTFLPAAVNTKMVMAIIGIGLVGIHCATERRIVINREILGATGFATLFSLICAFAVDYNHTDDMAYGSYVVSFAVWLFAAYTVCVAIRGVHGKVSFRLLTFYLAAVCLVQCVLALLIDSMPEFKSFINAYIEQDQRFLMEVDRLYGIGASLDNAGVRFSVVLIMIAALVLKDAAIRNNLGQTVFLLTAFFTIFLIGNVISRTTSIGGSIAFLYLLLNTGLFKLVIKQEYFKFHLIFGSLLVIAAIITVYYYTTNDVFYDYMRFAFEGFFNWIEKGEWRTASTDKLNNTMWVWPADTKTWLIGSGLFDNWIYGTDVGYCRFILYCGILGFSVFALFFIYNALIIGKRYKQYQDLFWMFLLLSFVIWVKVSTDIFLIYALFYCLDSVNKSVDNTPEIRNNEDRLLYSRHL